MQPSVKLVINGQFVESKTESWINNYNPATNELISRVPCATQQEMDSAIQSAEDAFPAWKDRSILSRQQIMFQFRDLIRKHWVSILYCVPAHYALSLHTRLFPACISVG